MNNDFLVQCVRTNRSYLKLQSPRDEKVLSALARVDREDFLPKEMCHLAYQDLPVSIGHGQYCSEPSMVAFMDDVLELEEGIKVLEIGVGCGYHAAVTLYLIGEKGRLVAIECIPEHVEFAGKNLRAHFKNGIEARLRIVNGDGSVGFIEEAPFDRIYSTAGVNINSFNPKILAEQLNPKRGILLFPEQNGSLFKQTYENGEMTGEEKFEGVSFVPLVGRNS